MRIGDFDTDARVLVIAEIGNNHEGSLERALELVRAAADAGADAVKFQTFRTEAFVAPSDAERFARLERFRLTPDEFSQLADAAHAAGILFVSTALDLESARVLVELADIVKVASGDNDFFPLLDLLASSSKPLVVSSGLTDLEALDASVAAVERTRAAGGDLGLLHCVSGYPTPPDEVNLRAIGLLADRYPSWTIGYSDHTLGIDAGPLAVAAGARIVEKHLTLDKQFSDFRDHQLSAEPQELAELVARIREAESFLGQRAKEIQPSEAANVVLARRSIAVRRDLPAGHALTLDDLVWLRPGDGIRPGAEDDVVGRVLRRETPAFQRLRLEDLG